MALASWMSMGGGTAQWASNMMVPSGPRLLAGFLDMAHERHDVAGAAGERVGTAGAELGGLGRGVHADLVAHRTAEEAIDRHAPEPAGDVPQRHVDGRDDVGDDGAAAHVTVGAIELLPQVLDAGGVFAVEQLEQRLGQDGRDLGLGAGDLAPAGDFVVGFDFDVSLGPTGMPRRLVILMLEVRSPTSAPGPSAPSTAPARSSPPAAAAPMISRLFTPGTSSFSDMESPPSRSESGLGEQFPRAAGIGGSIGVGVGQVKDPAEVCF